LDPIRLCVIFRIDYYGFHIADGYTSETSISYLLLIYKTPIIRYSYPFIVWYTLDAMNLGFLLMPILIISLTQVAHAQSLSDSINSAVTNDIKNTFDSIDSASNGNGNSSSGNNTGSQSTSTTTTTTSGPGNSNSTTTTMKTNSQ
jgi:hypothetical protein